MRFLLSLWLLGRLALAAVAAVPVEVRPVHGRHAMVVAGHPEAAAAGVAVLQAGGTAMDAAVAVSLSLGVAEPYGSGLGGKLALLHFEAGSGRLSVVLAMDQASRSLDPAAFAQLPAESRRLGWKSVCVPGLAAGLEAGHRRWGRRPWAENVAPAIELARRGFTILPRTRDLFAEREAVLRGGDPEIARLYLPGGGLPVTGSRLPNPDLAVTMEFLALGGADAFYRGPIAAAIARGVAEGGGVLTAEDFSRYAARVEEPVTVDWRGSTIAGAPPPTTGAALAFPILKALESESWPGGLRTPRNLDRLGRVWQQVQPHVARRIADVPEAGPSLNGLLAPEFVAEVRRKAGLEGGHPADTGAARSAAAPDGLPGGFFADVPDEVHASTTHFVVVDADSNVVCATQSLSLHFGAGVVAPGTGIILNDSMSNFAFSNPRSVNFPAPGKHPRSTITPVIVLRQGRPTLAVGIPGAQRIPTAVLQVLLDHLAGGRPLAEAIGDTRLHFLNPVAAADPNNIIEVEETLPTGVATELARLGWKVVRQEPAGTGRHFGGINAVELHPDGSRTGYADPRRTNVAAGY